MPFAFLINCGPVWILPISLFILTVTSAPYCLSPLELSLFLGFAGEHAWKISWIVHQTSTHLVSEITATVFSPALDCASSVGQNIFILGSGERLAIAAEETRCFPFYWFVLLLLFCWFLHLFSSLPYGQSYLFWYFSLPRTCYDYFFPTHLKDFTVTLPCNV